MENDRGPASIRLQQTAKTHEARFIQAVVRSADLHRPWVYPAATTSQFDAHLVRYSSDNQVSLLAVTGDSELVGCININEIVRGVFQSAYLGYYAFEPFAGTGMMFQAMRQVISYAFGELGLHRLEANIQPGNERSILLARSLDFRHEGFSPRYLLIDGKWRDHERYAITVEDLELSPPHRTDRSS